MIRILLYILFGINAFVVFWAMIGYPVSLRILSKLFKKRKTVKNYDNLPTVTLMVVAHNEEKVILEKLNNVMQLDYPQDRITYLIASDNSTDATNEIVTNYISEHSVHNMSLYCAKERKGKTNAQNEAQREVTSEFLVMTDANSMLHTDAIKELMAAFTDESIVYVTGALKYANSVDSMTSKMESGYWDSDLRNRGIESRIQTITAGNGALYACRNNEYVHFNPIKCHDSVMPLYYGVRGKRAICNHDAIAYEKAGENDKDEYKRKVRMNRYILTSICPDVRLLNVFKCRWFSYFYFGHRTCRYLLWISHLMLLITSILLSNSLIFIIILALQLVFYAIGLLQLLLHTKNKYMKAVFYYCMTVCAQWNGVWNILTGKAKPTWEKAQSTR